MSTAALLQPGATFVLNAGFAWLAGTLCARAWLARGHPALFAHCATQLQRAAIGACVACLGGSLAALWAAAALMADVGLGKAFGMLPMVVQQTAYGHAALAGIVAAGVLLALLWAPRWHGSAAATGIALLLFALSRVALGHAGENGLLTLAAAVEWLHLVLVGAWVGAVMLAAWVILPAARRHGTAVQAYLRWLSAVATLALAGIVASGLFNTWQRLGRLGQLVDNPYGLALCVKLALVAMAVLLGAYNRWYGFPHAVRGRLRPALLVLRLEALLLLGAIGAAAWLVTLPPPA